MDNAVKILAWGAAVGVLIMPSAIAQQLGLSDTSSPQTPTQKISSTPATQAPNPPIDYDEFVAISNEVAAYREKRKISLADFVKYQQEPGTIVLDTRSARAYNRKHIKNAVHLNFSDFTAEKLAALIPDKNTRILIYCNNNFANDPVNFATKMAPLALNIPTFINLYGYGYQNIYELSDYLNGDEPSLEFAGTDIATPINLKEK